MVHLCPWRFYLTGFFFFFCPPTRYRPFSLSRESTANINEGVCARLGGNWKENKVSEKGCTYKDLSVTRLVIRICVRGMSPGRHRIHYYVSPNCHQSLFWNVDLFIWLIIPISQQQKTINTPRLYDTVGVTFSRRHQRTRPSTISEVGSTAPDFRIYERDQACFYIYEERSCSLRCLTETCTCMRLDVSAMTSSWPDHWILTVFHTPTFPTTRANASSLRPKKRPVRNGACTRGSLDGRRCKKTPNLWPSQPWHGRPVMLEYRTHLFPDGLPPH